MLTPRQKALLEYISTHKIVTREQIQEYIATLHYSSSKASIVRDINALLELGYITRNGKTKGTLYSSTPDAYIHTEFNIEEYFSVDIDERTLRTATFDDTLVRNLRNVLTDEEKEYTNTCTLAFRNNIAGLFNTVIQKELGRITIEFA